VRLAGSALALVLAANTAAAQTGVRVRLVTDANTGRPLQQVRVQIVGNQQAVTATDPSGRFLIRNIPCRRRHPSSPAARLSTRNATDHN
jgi:hypothetical protein